MINPVDGVYTVCTDQTVAIGATASSIPEITWEWAYDRVDDSGDTALGTAATAPTVSVTATIVATQVD